MPESPININDYEIPAFTGMTMGTIPPINNSLPGSRIALILEKELTIF